MRRVFACLLIGAFTATAPGADNTANLVKNPGFEQDADGDGVPDAWRWAGDRRLVTQTLALDKGRDGHHSARLACSRYEPGNPAAHAMLCQMDVPVRRGKLYHVTLWAKAEKITSDVVFIALSDTSCWADCGLQDAFVPTPRWQRYEFIFRAKRDCLKAGRFQIWFQSTGTLWVEDVCFEEGGRDLYQPGNKIPAGASANLVPNASFECGTDGWGSAEWDRKMHWGGRINRLFGTLDKEQAVDGRCSLRIDLGPDNQPVSFFDYYELCRTAIRAPLAASVGFIEVEPGRRHTLSVFMKADKSGTPARLAVRQFQGGHSEKGVLLSTDWQRYALTFTPRAEWCYVLAGPDLRKSDENPDPPQRATLWLDAVELRPGEKPETFITREPVECGVVTDRPGNVFGWDEPVRIRLAVSNSDSAGGREVTIDLRLTDFFDKEVWRESIRVDVPAGQRVEREVIVGPKPELRGFLRLSAKTTSGDIASRQTMRLAVIPIYPGGDSRFGVNHAYPWPHLLDLSRKAGLVWVRDWSLKWQEVEPEKGRFTFVETDYQIDRPLAHKLRVLGLLPFPSSHWLSSAPPSVTAGDRYPQSRQRVAYAPRDLAEFENYVARTVGHYKGRVTWWQVFNEPLFTSYALPRKHGYDGATYAKYVKAFARAARRADPECRVLAGIGYLREGEILDDFEKLFAAGGLEAIDAVDVHHYPRLRPPEFIEKPLEELNELMERHGGRKPIWLTEYGYYADDDPWSLPMPHSGFNRPLASEQLQGEYAVRWATIMMAGGVEKIFYHAGTCGGVNNDSLQGVFYKYAGTPHKIYAAQAVMAHLFTPACRFVKRLDLAEGVKGYLFRDGRRSVAVVWAVRGAKTKPLRLADERQGLWDMMGRPQASRRLTPCGTPVYIVAHDLADDAFTAALKPVE